MTTNNSINLSAAGVVAYNGSGTFTGSPITQHDVLVGGSSNAITSISPSTSGFVLTSNGTGADPTFQAPALVLMTWVDVTGTTQAMSINTGYVSDNAGLVTLTLPATAAFGSILRIVGKGAGGWKIAQNASQQILVGTNATTVGTGGSVSSSYRTDTIELLATTAGSSTVWTDISHNGNLTLV